MTNEPNERDLLAAARRALSPTAADQERVRRATAAALAAGATGPAVGGAATSRALPWASRIVVVGVVAAVAAGIGYRTGRRAGREEATPERPPVATAPAALPSAAPGSASGPRPSSVSSTPTALPVDGQAARTAPHHRAVADAALAPPAPVVPAVSLAEEVRALRAVERALRDGNPGFALALLRELRSRGPERPARRRAPGDTYHRSLRQRRRPHWRRPGRRLCGALPRQRLWSAGRRGLHWNGFRAVRRHKGQEAAT